SGARQFDAPIAESHAALSLLPSGGGWRLLGVGVIGVHVDEIGLSELAAVDAGPVGQHEPGRHQQPTRAFGDVQAVWEHAQQRVETIDVVDVDARGHGSTNGASGSGGAGSGSGVSTKGSMSGLK